MSANNEAMTDAAARELVEKLGDGAAKRFLLQLAEREELGDFLRLSLASGKVLLSPEHLSLLVAAGEAIPDKAPLSGSAKTYMGTIIASASAAAALPFYLVLPLPVLINKVAHELHGVGRREGAMAQKAIMQASVEQVQFSLEFMEDYYSQILLPLTALRAEGSQDVPLVEAALSLVDERMRLAAQEGGVDIEAPGTENITHETASGIVDAASRLANRYLNALAASHVDYTKIADDRPVIALPGLAKMLEAGDKDKGGGFMQRLADLREARMLGTGIHPRTGAGRW